MTTDNNWRVEIDTGGGTISPPVSSGVTFEPGINDIPRARVPVPADDRYAKSIGPGAPARLYYRGDKLPIDELITIDRESSDQTDTLVLEGGLDLTDYQDQITVEGGLAADAVAGLLSDASINVNTTQYAPAGTVQTRTEYDAPPSSVFRPNEFTPVTDTGQPAKVAFTREAEDFGDVNNSVGGPVANASNDKFAKIDEFDTQFVDGQKFQFTTEYTILTAKFAVRVSSPSGAPNDNSSVEVALDGEPVGQFGNIHEGSSNFAWYILGEDPNSSWTGPTIQPGDHTLKITPPPKLDDERRLDVVSLFDERARPGLTFEENLSSGERVDGPEEYPDAADLPAGGFLSVPTKRVRSLRPITEVSMTVFSQGPQTGFTAELTTDSARTFERSQGSFSGFTTATQTDPAPAGVVLPFYGLAGVDFGNGTPATGNQPVGMEIVDLNVTTEDRRVVRSQERRGELLTVLQDLAETADALFEIGTDSSGKQVLRWDYPSENRTARETAAVASVSATTSNDDQAERVRVFGASTSFEQTVQFPANGSVSLNASFIVPGSEAVTREDTGTDLERNVDYELRAEQDPAELVSLPAGPTEVQPDVTISANEKIAGEATVDGVSNPTTVEISGLSLQQDFAAKQAAQIALDDLSEPRREATLRLSDFDPRDSLLDPLTAPQIPFEPERITSVDVQAGEVAVGLASRASAADVIASLRRRSEQLARSV